MMSEPKPFASLSSGLLARKGQARPAMRPQGFTGGYASLAGIEDLGWNDMGHMPEPMADVHPLHEDDQIQPPPEGVPPVLAQRHALKQEFEPVLEELAGEEAEVSVEAPVETLVTAPVPVLETFEPRPISVAAAGRIARATPGRGAPFAAAPCQRGQRSFGPTDCYRGARRLFGIAARSRRAGTPAPDAGQGVNWGTLR
jgi:hypothetical protein